MKPKIPFTSELSLSNPSDQSHDRPTTRKHKVPPTVNFHLTKYCNMRCSFCYATFSDLGIVKHNFEKSQQIIRALAEAGFEKITFAGGEPTLVRELPELAKLAKSLGMITTIVTNGAKLGDPDYYDQITPHFDWVAISIDSINPETNLKSGRAVNGKNVLSREFYQEILQKLRRNGIKTKINTVVSAYNFGEDLTEFINACQPKRWKILQATPIEGQNSQNSGKFEVEKAQFNSFLRRNSSIDPETTVVAEEIDLIKGSYVMVSPEGKFYDNSLNGYIYSQSLLEIGVKNALGQVNFDYDKFLQRGGKYDF
ncbi:MAG: radical SAM protein [Bacteroidia bacterium]|nr:radical SAM protein [Bacteroidia bacterium]